jgi:phosphonopyruvate decarboxylase
MKSSDLCALLTKEGFGPFTGVPCSSAGGLIHHAETSADLDYYAATSEGEAMGLAGGFALSGKRPVVIMQNDGLGNAVNPISSLQQLYALPTLMIITWRGEPGTKPDAAQHLMMGEILTDLLGLMDIPYRVLEDDLDATGQMVQEAKAHMEATQRPFALIVRRGLLDGAPKIAPDTGKPMRLDHLRAMAELVDDKDIILGTTGFTGREVSSVFDNGPVFYMAGSMGCAASVGLALALDNQDRRVFVLDGDGAVLMKLGTLATAGNYAPKNLFHVVFDNGLYESTGGQNVPSRTVNFPGIARNAGYKVTDSLASVEAFKQALSTAKIGNGPVFWHLPISSGTVADLPRPKASGEELRDRFMAKLGG